MFFWCSSERHFFTFVRSYIPWFTKHCHCNIVNLQALQIKSFEQTQKFYNSFIIVHLRVGRFSQSFPFFKVFTHFSSNF